MGSSILKWLERYRKRRAKELEEQYTFPAVTIQPGAEYVPQKVYETLEERVTVLERSLHISQNPVDKLEIPAEVLTSFPTVVKSTIEGVIFNYEHDFPDFCFLGMRKALIDAIRIRFQKDQQEDLLYDPDGNAYTLPKWIELAKQKRYISSNMAAGLTERVKVFGDTASHDYMANLQKEEVPAIFTLLRIALSRMFYSEETT
jgi:hypothetical protein